MDDAPDRLAVLDGRPELPPVGGLEGGCVEQGHRLDDPGSHDPPRRVDQGLDENRPVDPLVKCLPGVLGAGLLGRPGRRVEVEDGARSSPFGKCL